MITATKPSLERIEPSFGSSFAIKKFDQSHPNQNPFWHFHPEMELVYIESGSGKRHIGNHVSYYNGGDLIFIGSNLPHYGFTDRFSSATGEIVIQMREDFLGEGFFNIPEMRMVKAMFERSKAGLVFYGKTREIVAERLFDLLHMDGVEKLTAFIHILQVLAKSKEYHSLNASGVSLVLHQQDNDRIDRIYAYVQKRFKDDITLEEASELVNMTIPAFCRYFKKLTKKTFIQFVHEFRVVHACKLLSEEAMTITEICYESGFNNFSHFTRVFKKVTGKSPSEYRKAIGKFILT
ncbi:MAG TPA: AraC family transcriptional regulator [Saprospiraceae bacterium]|nr:AraC family transcriptional regulator [Saprospiraceae bacterium]